ncbi:MAG TPA: hypothetical protein PKE47_06475 [Verrucomicrobiota bacterium]|nr:hypothetical protein [Verrucomicrobiota bacterium]
MRPALLWLILAAVAAAPLRAQDAALLEERLARLTATVEALEVAFDSQKRQIAALTEQLQQLRAEAARSAGRSPSYDDLQKLAEKLAEVDRKRVADNEQILKALEDLRKLPAAAARTAPRTPEREPDRAPPALRADQAIEHTVGRGQSISQIVSAFNADARRQGFKPLTVDEVMRFNGITDARRLREGQKLQLPLLKE